MTRQVSVLLLSLCATVAAARVAQVPGGDEVKTFDVVASRFMFEPAILSVYEGERVRLRVRSADGIHGIAIKAFRVKAWIPAGGEIVNVEFLAGQSGTFDIVCSEYCGSRHGAMKGRLIVLPRKTGTG